MKRFLRVASLGILCILTASVSFAQIGIFDASVDVDNGQLGAAGSAAYDPATDTYTVTGSGADVWNNTGSNFHFLYREWTGDFDFRADVTVSGGLETQDWIKSMLFCAEGLEGESNYITTRVRRDGQYSTQWRTGGAGSDGSTPGDLRVSGLNPARQRLTRIGNTFTTYYMNEDGEWAVIDTNEAVLAETVYLGFGVCSHDLGEIATGTFSKVALGAPMEGLFDMTIDVDNGQLGAEGSAAYAGGTYTIEGSGQDVWNNTGSNFRFVYTELSGDFELTADVAIAGGLETQDWIKAMLYAAESLDGWGNYITTRVRRDGQYSTQWRTGGEASDGSTPGDLRVSGLNPARQRLTRSGNSFTTSYLDADGNWQVIDTNEAVLSDPLFVGLGVCSHDLGEIAVGTFSNIELTQGGGGSMGIFENAVTLDAAEYDHVAVPGSVSESDGVYTLMGNGRDIWDNGDEAFFVYNELAGSNSIQAKVKWIDAKGGDAGGNDWAKIGVMIREKGDVPESKHYWIELRCGAGDPALGDRTDAQWREVEGQASGNVQIFQADGTSNVASPDGVWYRVSRNASADLMTSEYSMDGITWTVAHSMTMEMADVAAYGIIITSHTGDDQIVTAEASDVKITQAHPTSSASNWELFK